MSEDSLVPPAISIRRLVICAVIAASLFLVPVSADFTSNMRFICFVGLLMALMWLTEAVPMGLTALLPLILIPLAGIQTTEKVAAPYANSAVFLFLGGFLVSSAVEKWGLHRRVAFGVLSRVGTEPRRIVLAVLLVTVLLSMWMSNTATTLLMTPIAVALVRDLKERDKISGGDENSRLAESTLLAVGYGASLGGIATPIGTPTNLIFLGAAKELFPKEPAVSFAQWMGFGVLYLLLAVPACWIILIVAGRLKAGAAVPLAELGFEKPGPITRGERTTAILFFITALLWIFRADIALGSFIIPGWSNILPNPKAANDATVAVAMSFLAFLIPVGGGRRLLEWEQFRKLPWDVLILFGGGFALADSLEASGFSKWAGAQLSFVGQWPPVAMILIICIVVTLLSEVASNVATATAMMPVVAAVAIAIGVHPYFLMLPAVLAASSGFMLPVATAPNTIVYGTGLIRVKQMARVGVSLDAVCALVITLLLFTAVPKILGIVMSSPVAR